MGTANWRASRWGWISDISDQISGDKKRQEFHGRGNGEVPEEASEKTGEE